MNNVTCPNQLKIYSLLKPLPQTRFMSTEESVFMWAYHLAVPWLRQLVTGLSLQTPRLTLVSLHVGFVVGKVALGQLFLRSLQFHHQYDSAVALHTHISGAVFLELWSAVVWEEKALQKLYQTLNE
jgi:hypothetical protein